MSAMFYLIPVSIVMGLMALAGFVWTLQNRQYDDPEGDRFRVLDDSDIPTAPKDYRSL